jgi:hypothetical protein
MILLHFAVRRFLQSVWGPLSSSYCNLYFWREKMANDLLIGLSCCVVSGLSFGTMFVPFRYCGHTRDGNHLKRSFWIDSDWNAHKCSYFNIYASKKGLGSACLTNECNIFKNFLLWLQASLICTDRPSCRPASCATIFPTDRHDSEFFYGGRQKSNPAALIRLASYVLAHGLALIPYRYNGHISLWNESHDKSSYFSIQ